ncbi:reverse transcriptase/maturase family protein [Leptospira interrogans]|uniref:RNA-directed DNA polymerase n=2 Tax=Leptospira interrogans TaxID=173 RepID=A0AAP9WH14_LEPIR|nr:reverse transcriptase domain-containing protein [Leptospira interrogans]MCL8312649.1 reverse transcriptase/maturase family protein [Leptospira interrogans]QOI44972.1 RNA-directed DNA polymerase [Leptospira interrogans serovar Canicola]
MRDLQNRIDQVNQFNNKNFGTLVKEQKKFISTDFRKMVGDLGGRNTSDLRNEIGQNHSQKGYIDINFQNLLTAKIIGEAILNLQRGSAPGVDNTDVYKIMRYGRDYCFSLYNKIMNHTYKAAPYKIVKKPKDQANPLDFREIGIFTTQDKIVQRIISEILEQIFEPQFVDNSFGYRVGRSFSNAAEYIESELNKGEFEYAVVIDIRKYFDSIPHPNLMSILREHIYDPELLNQIEGFLKSIKKIDAVMAENSVGTPQGSILGPILSNIFLHTILDIPLLQKYENTAYVRFADDFICFTKTQEEANEIKRFISEVLNNNHLHISIKNGEPIRNSKVEPIFFVGYKIEFKEDKYVVLPSPEKIRKRQIKLLDSIGSAIDINLFLFDFRGYKDVPKKTLNTNYFSMIDKYKSSLNNYLNRDQDIEAVREINNAFIPELLEVLFSKKMENYQRRDVRNYAERKLVKSLGR